VSGDEFDRKLREAWRREPVDTSTLERAIRHRIGQRRRLGRYATAAAVALMAVAAFEYRAQRLPAMFADAALDHRLEVVEKAPRRWRTFAGDIEPLLARFGWSGRQAEVAGYRLVRAKICGLEGTRALHLVYSDGKAEYSFYVLPRGMRPVPDRDVQQGREHVTGFRKGLVVVDGSEQDCHRFVTLLSPAA
jgi:hypothetical protein